MRQPKITARKHGGNDRASWAVFVDGHMFVNGLTQREVQHYKDMALRLWKAKYNG